MVSPAYLDVLRVVDDKQGGALEGLLAQVALVLRVQVSTPRHWELELGLGFEQELDSFCVAHSSKRLGNNILQAAYVLHRFQNCPWESTGGSTDIA